MWIDDTNGTKINPADLFTYVRKNVSKDDLLELIGKCYTLDELFDFANLSCDICGINFMSELSFRREV